MLDVHILTLPDSNKEWFSRCLSSVMDAVDHAGFPVRIHVVSGYVGNIGKGRSIGYSHGDFPYVSCVDDDDYILPHAFAQMHEALKSDRYDAISTKEHVLRNGYLSEGKQRHHLIAYRRNAIIQHQGWLCCGDVAQMTSIPSDGWFDCLHSAYVHRVYESRARLMRRENHGELKKAFLHG